MLPDLSFSSLFVIATVAFGVPLCLGLAPRVRLPSVVLEIVVGILIGPSVLGWATIDPPVQVLALLGVAFTLFLAGLEINLAQLRGPLLRLTGLGFALSLLLALSLSLGMSAVGLVQRPLFIAIVLAATALGVVIPLLKDTGQSATPFGQLVLLSASLADFGTIILLSLFFSREATSPLAQVTLIGALAGLAILLTLGLRRVGHSPRLNTVLTRLQDSSAQIRVRGAFFLLALFVALAERAGVEVILGAFMAGAILNFISQAEPVGHSHFKLKLDAIGFGIFIPFFFVSSGVRFNLTALVSDSTALARVPLFLAAVLLIRGLPALFYLRTLGPRNTAAAGLLQATQLGFFVVAAQIGMELGQLDEATGAALVAAALLSVLLFPAGALALAQPASSQPTEGRRTSEEGELSQA